MVERENLPCQYNSYNIILSTPAPSPITDVNITSLTCNSVVVNWTPPADNGSAELTQYRVLVYKDSTQLQVIVNTTITTTKLSHQVSSLEPDTNYTVEVKAENVGGFRSGTSTNFTTKQTGLNIIDAFTHHYIAQEIYH